MAAMWMLLENNSTAEVVGRINQQRFDITLITIEFLHKITAV